MYHCANRVTSLAQALLALAMQKHDISGFSKQGTLQIIHYHKFIVKKMVYLWYIHHAKNILKLYISTIYKSPVYIYLCYTTVSPVIITSLYHYHQFKWWIIIIITSLYLPLGATICSSWSSLGMGPALVRSALAGQPAEQWQQQQPGYGCGEREQRLYLTDFSVNTSVYEQMFVWYVANTSS